MLEFEIITHEELNEILEGQAALDAGDGDGDRETSENDESSEPEEKPRNKKKSSKKEPEKDEESGEGEGNEDGDGDDEGEKDDPDAWYSTGYEESDKVSDREAAGGDNKAWRFFLKGGQETEVIIIDSGVADKKKWGRKGCAPFNVWEHNFAIVSPDDPEDLTFYDVTCVRGRLNAEGKPRKCFVCEKRKKIQRKFHSMYTVLSKYEGKKGTTWGKKLLPANKKLLKTLKRRERKGGLFGMKFNVFRSDNQSARVGDDWAYEEHLDADAVAELLGERMDLAPLDYVDECRPMTWEELENLLKDAILSDPRKSGGKKKPRRASRDDDDDRPRRSSSRDDDDDKPRRNRDREDEKDEGSQEDRPKRRPREEKDDDASDEKPRRRAPKDDDDGEKEDRPKRRPAKEESSDDQDDGDSDEGEKEETQGSPLDGGDGDDIPF